MENGDVSSCGAVTIRIDHSDGLNVRTETKNTYLRQVTNRNVDDRYICRSVIRKISMEEMESGISSGYLQKCIKVTGIDKVRNRLKMNPRRNGNCGAEEHIEVMEFEGRESERFNGGRSRTIRASMYIEGNLIGARIRGIQKRRTRRRIGRAEDFLSVCLTVMVVLLDVEGTKEQVVALGLRKHRNIILKAASKRLCDARII